MSSKAPLGFGVLLCGALFLALPTTVVVMMDWRTLSEAGIKLIELTYASTPGEVVSSELESKVDGDDRVSWVKIAYRYTLNGRTYTGSRAESHPLPSTGSWAANYVKARPPGTSVTVRFDSSRPATAVLEPGFTRNDPFYLLVLLPPNVYLGLGWYYFWRLCSRGENRPSFEVTGSSRLRRVQLRQRTTWGIPLAIALFGMPAGYALSFIAAGPRASAWPGLLTALGLLALAIQLYRKRVADVREGRIDLVIDRQIKTLTLPCTYGRRRAVVVPFAAVRSVKVEERICETEDSTIITYRPTVNWDDAGGAKRGDVIAEWSDKDVAKELVSWVKGQVAKG
jgi:hypothetical protein